MTIRLFTKITALGLALSLRAPDFAVRKSGMRKGKGQRKANKANRWK